MAVLAVVAGAACVVEEPPVATEPPVVVPAVPVVVLSAPPYLERGTSAQLQVRLVHAPQAVVTWASDDPAVLAVDEAGVAHGVGPGLARATVTVLVDGIPYEDSKGVFVQVELPYVEAWLRSGHADPSAESFAHWDDEGEIPVACARCHATSGLLDHLGADGSEPGVQAPAPTGEGITCEGCHDAAVGTLATAAFPSGVVVEELGNEAVCLQCHQGRAAGATVAELVKSAGLQGTPDQFDVALTFTDVHLSPAGATLYAGQVQGGYEYPERTYDHRFRHVSGLDVCQGCHDPHDLTVRVETCAACHPEATSNEGLRQVRSLASRASDFDGDGDVNEGIAMEIAGVRERLLALLQRYVVERGQAGLCHAPGVYPYFFVDTDLDGACSEAEARYANATPAWSPRAVAAAYNLNLSTQDGGTFAHNAKYTLQLLHDSGNDLAGAVVPPHDWDLVRSDEGHFDGAGEAARHWDDDVAVSASCSQCHGGSAGLEFYLSYGVGLEGGAPDNGLECETCHTALPDYRSIRDVEEVTFASGVSLAGTEPTDPLCMSCHQGRQARATVDARIAAGSFGFSNVHYLPAGAVQYGADAAVGYEYDGRTYATGWTDHTGGSGCIDCHDPVASNHSFLVEDAFASTCAACHLSATSSHDIRLSDRHGADYDGDGSVVEPLVGEIEGLAAALLEAMQAQASLCYRAGTYPYFFEDGDADGVCSEGEASRANAFRGWTPALMRAAFNYQLAQTDRGGWAHNFDYLAQLLHDGVADLGGDTSGFTRP